MSRANDRLEEVLRGLTAGELDGLTPDQVARLEGLLNRRPNAATQLADVRPTPEPRLRAAIDALDRAARPAPAAWDAMWSRIEAATAPATSRPGWFAPRLLRVWRPVAAAAACLLLAVTWLLTGPRPGPTSLPEPWPIRLAAHVDFDVVEVGEGVTPVLVATGAEATVDVIWLVQAES